MTKTILTITALVLVAISLLAFSFRKPKQIQIISKVWVDAPASVVYDKIRFQENFPTWSPFKVKDPQQTHKISGADGEIGSRFYWIGGKEKSQGFQEIVSLSPNREIRFSCTIKQPYEAYPNFTYRLSEKEGGVEVVQQFDLEIKFPTTIIAKLIGLEKEMSITNQMGLDLLKTVTEEPVSASL